MQDKMAPLEATEATSHTLVKNLLKRTEGWVWPGRGSLRFERSGKLVVTSREPGGEGGFVDGTWGTVPSPWRKDSLHVQMGGATYLLMFLSEKWVFVALRCSDEQVTYGRLDAENVPEQRLVF